MYDGTTDLIELHDSLLTHHVSSQSFTKKKKAVMCKMFPASLKGVALTWFDSLESKSINSLRNWSTDSEHSSRPASKLGK